VPTLAVRLKISLNCLRSLRGQKSNFAHLGKLIFLLMCTIRYIYFNRTAESKVYSISEMSIDYQTSTTGQSNTSNVIKTMFEKLLALFNAESPISNSPKFFSEIHNNELVVISKHNYIYYRGFGKYNAILVDRLAVGTKMHCIYQNLDITSVTTLKRTTSNGNTFANILVETLV